MSVGKCFDDGVLMQTHEVARVLGLTPAAVRLITKGGKLSAAAVTAHGTRLYHREDVECLRQQRVEAAQLKQAKVRGSDES